MSKFKSFHSKVAVVTGAASGIGRELAIQLAESGARLALSDVNQEGLEETMNQLPAGTLAKGYSLNVSSWEDFNAHAAEVKKEFGSVHYIFNNAGVTVAGTVEHTSVEDMEWLLGINLHGVMYGTKAFLPIMLDQREGCIVNISSVFGFIGVPGQATYNISKFGVRGFTEALWQELEGTGVRAVCVHPGAINTNIASSARLVEKGVLSKEDTGAQERFKKLLTGSPRACAREILQGVDKGKKRVLAGPKSRILFHLPRIFPNTYGTILKALGLSF